MKRTDLLLGIAVLLVPLGGCALNPLSDVASPTATAKATPAPDAKKPAAAPTDLASAIVEAQAARKSGDLPGAAKILSQLVLLAPDDARVLGEYGKTMAAQGRSDDALAFLDRATQLEPNDWSLYSAEGVALDQKGNYRAAQASYAHALMLKPGDPSVLNNDALSHVQAGDLDGAEKLLQQAAPGTADNPRIAENLALVQSLKAAQAAKPVADVPAAPAPTAPAPVQTASATPPAPAPVAPVAVEPLAPMIAPAAAVEAATLEAPAMESPANSEASAVDALKADPTVRMQALPKNADTAPLPHDLPAKAEPSQPQATEKKLVQKTPAATPAPVPPPARASKPSTATAVAKAPSASAPAKAASTSVPAPKLITTAARTPSPANAFYVQAGSYPSEARAGEAASALDSMGARVMTGMIDGHAVYRVRIGPFLNVRQANAAIEQAHALGHADLVIVTE